MSNVEKQLELIKAIDKQLRSNIADLYMALNEVNDPARSIEMLSVHVAMLVDMINDFKKK
jgi:hypothetical protein